VIARRSSAPRSGPRLGRAGLRAAVAAGVIAALGVFHVWSRTRVLEAGYQLSSLQEEHARLVAAQDQLQLELSMLTSFRALDQTARGKLARLGLAPPDRGAVWAAGPDRAIAGPSQAGGNGDGHRPRPAGPILASAGTGGGAWPEASAGRGGAQSAANARRARSFMAGSAGGSAVRGP
jgi:hypothetical protein